MNPATGRIRPSPASGITPPSPATRREWAEADAARAEASAARASAKTKAGRVFLEREYDDARDAVLSAIQSAGSAGLTVDELHQRFGEGAFLDEVLHGLEYNREAFPGFVSRRNGNHFLKGWRDARYNRQWQRDRW